VYRTQLFETTTKKRFPAKDPPFFLFSLLVERNVGRNSNPRNSLAISMIGGGDVSALAQQPQDKRRQHKATSKQANEEVSDVTGDVHASDEASSGRLLNLTTMHPIAYKTDNVSLTPTSVPVHCAASAVIGLWESY
jgi:hypothetical protein